MTPTKFKQQNAELQKPSEMTDEECSPLPVWRDAPLRTSLYISCWRMSWRERLRALFTGRVWLWCHSFAHPPIALDVNHPFPKRVFAAKLKIWHNRFWGKSKT
jgi:hypothetical protein